MFVVTLTYTVDLDRIDALLDEHVAWLDRHYASGLFVGSGRREPRVGGVIIAAGHDRAALDAALADDPFGRADATTYDVVEFFATKGPLARFE